MRRNAFAGADEPGDPPSWLLGEMPQVATGAVLLRRGHPRRGRRRTTVGRSVRLPEELWRELERTARSKHLNLHQAMRAALSSSHVMRLSAHGGVACSCAVAAKERPSHSAVGGGFDTIAAQ